MDLEIGRLRCSSRLAPRVELECEKCGVVCYTEQCMDVHKRHCRKMEYCDECQVMYKKSGKGSCLPRGLLPNMLLVL